MKVARTARKLGIEQNQGLLFFGAAREFRKTRLAARRPNLTSRSLKDILNFRDGAPNLFHVLYRSVFGIKLEAVA